MISTKTLITGRAAEHFVCYDLAKRGIRASVSPFEGAPYDVLAEFGGVMVRIQVKGSNTITLVGKSKQYRYYFTSPIVEADLIAFVALDIEKIVYEVPREVGSSLKRSFSIANLAKADDSALISVFGEKLTHGIKLHQKPTK